MPSPPVRPRPRRAHLILLGIACLLFIGHALPYHQWVEDDAYISFRYGANLAAGDGLVFNAGERVEGYSNFAWVLVAAATEAAGLDPLPVAQGLGLLGGLCAVVCSWVLTRRLWPQHPQLALLAPFFLAVAPVLPRHAMTGLETTAYAGLLSLAICLDGAENRRTPLLVPVLLILALLRPEGVAFALLILLWRLGSWPRILAFTLVFGAYYAWRWTWFGAPVTNTFFFKMTGGRAAIVDGLIYTREFLRDMSGPTLVGFTLCLLAGRALGRLFWLLTAVIAAQVALVVLAGGDWMSHARFFAPVLPCMAAMSAAGVAALWTTTAGNRRRHAVRLLAGLLLIVSTANMIRTEVAVSGPALSALHDDGYLTQTYARLGRWLRAETAPDATVAISDVGAVGYVSQRTIIDMFGLIDAHIARRPGRLHFKSDPQYVLSRKPDYVVLVYGKDHEGRPGYLRIPDRDLAATAEFRRLYRDVHREPIRYRNEEIIVFRRCDPGEAKNRLPRGQL